MKKATGRLDVSIIVDCPYCDEYLDLFIEEDANVLNDEGQLWSLINASNDRGHNPWKDIDIKCTCHKCKKDFVFDELEY